MATPKILIAGATGNVGPTLVELLAGAGHPVRVLARDPAKAAKLLGTAVEIVRGDLEDPTSLAAAFRGVSSAFVATTPTPSLDRQEINFIDAARAAKVLRVVKLSGFGIEFSADRIHAAHARSERSLRASGIPSVVLRPVVYMSNLLFDAAAVATGKLPSVFRDGRINLVDPRDVAAVAARTLVDPEHVGRTLEFGGPEALSWDDVAATLARVLGRRVEHVRLDDATFEAGVLQAGLPDFVVEAITSTASATRTGKYEVDDTVVQRVVGRRASSLAAWVARNREAFQPHQEIT